MKTFLSPLCVCDSWEEYRISRFPLICPRSFEFTKSTRSCLNSTQLSELEGRFCPQLGVLVCWYHNWHQRVRRRHFVSAVMDLLRLCSAWDSLQDYSDSFPTHNQDMQLIEQQIILLFFFKDRILSEPHSKHGRFFWQNHHNQSMRGVF